LAFKRRLVVEAVSHKVTVQLDINTFDRIKDFSENYALVQLINADESGSLSAEDAKQCYASLDKASWKSDKVNFLNFRPGYE
jgi:hypothetical protein